MGLVVAMGACEVVGDCVGVGDVGDDVGLADVGDCVGVGDVGGDGLVDAGDVGRLGDVAGGTTTLLLGEPLGLADVALP